MDLLAEEVKAFWGNRLVRWPRDALAHIPLRAFDAEYLVTVGLPSRIASEIGLDVSPQQSSEQFKAELLLLGRNRGFIPIYLELETGCILSIWKFRQLVNSSLRQYGGFLMYFEMYCREAVRIGNDEPRRKQLVDKIESLMRALDPKIMEDPAAYWPPVLFDIHNELS